MHPLPPTCRLLQLRIRGALGSLMPILLSTFVVKSVVCFLIFVVISVFHAILWGSCKVDFIIGTAKRLSRWRSRPRSTLKPKASGLIRANTNRKFLPEHLCGKDQESETEKNSPYSGSGALTEAYHSFSALHTYANKATGALIFAFPLLYALLGLTVSGVILCAAAFFSSVEELIITGSSPTLNRDCKGIYMRSDKS